MWRREDTCRGWASIQSSFRVRCTGWRRICIRYSYPRRGRVRAGQDLAAGEALAAAGDSPAVGLVEAEAARSKTPPQEGWDCVAADPEGKMPSEQPAGRRRYSILIVRRLKRCCPTGYCFPTIYCCPRECCCHTPSWSPREYWIPKPRCYCPTGCCFPRGYCCRKRCHRMTEHR